MLLYRKIKPLEEVLGGAVAWVSGLRRDQSPTRANTNFINKDERFKSVKVCPLIYWTEDEVWDYIKKHDLPYNALHDDIILVLVVSHVPLLYLTQRILEQDVGRISIKQNVAYMLLINHNAFG